MKKLVSKQGMELFPLAQCLSGNKYFFNKIDAVSLYLADAIATCVGKEAYLFQNAAMRIQAKEVVFDLIIGQNNRHTIVVLAKHPYQVEREVFGQFDFFSKRGYLYETLDVFGGIWPRAIDDSVTPLDLGSKPAADN